MSLLYKVTRRSLSVPLVLLRRDTAQEADLLVLRHENAVLRRQLVGSTRYEPAARLWFATLSELIPRRRWREIFPVTPGALLVWHRRFMAALLTPADGNGDRLRQWIIDARSADLPTCTPSLAVSSRTSTPSSPRSPYLTTTDAPKA